jgi:hypothetical protein
MVGGRSRATEVVLFKKIRLGMRLVGAARSVPFLPAPAPCRHSERSEESPRKQPSRVHASRPFPPRARRHSERSEEPPRKQPSRVHASRRPVGTEHHEQHALRRRTPRVIASVAKQSSIARFALLHALRRPETSFTT